MAAGRAPVGVNVRWREDSVRSVSHGRAHGSGCGTRAEADGSWPEPHCAGAGMGKMLITRQAPSDLTSAWFRKYRTTCYCGLTMTTMGAPVAPT
jgi:hypothetical protein